VKYIRKDKRIIIDKQKKKIKNNGQFLKFQ